MKGKKKEKKSNASKDNKKTEKKLIKRVNVKEALPFSFDKEKNMFVKKDGSYIQMVCITGTNLFGFKETDKASFINAFSLVFSNTIGKGQIYSYEISADVDGYIEDYQFFMDSLDLTNEIGCKKYDILERAQNRMKFTASTRELVDRCFLFVFADKDINRLEQRCNEVIQTMSPFQSTFMLTWEEMFGVLYNFYRPSNARIFDEDPKEIEDIMDYLYPTRIGRVERGFKQCLETDGIYSRTRYISYYKKMPKFAQLSYLATYKEIDFSLHFEPAESGAISKEMDKELRNIRKNLEKAKEHSESTKLQKKEAETEELIDSVVADGSLPYVFTVVVRIKSDSLDMIDKIAAEMDKDFLPDGIAFRDGVFEPMELFHMSAPICHNELPHYGKLTTSETLGFMYPFVFEALYDSTPMMKTEKDGYHSMSKRHYPPVYIGNTIQTNGVVFYDNFTKKDDRSNYNEFIAGNSGMGKTFFLMWLINTRYALGYKQYLIDVEGKELNKLTYALHGANINCADGSKGRINPMHIRLNIPDSDTGENKVPLKEIKPLAAHIRFLRAFFNAYKGNTTEIGLLNDNTIEQAIESVYSDYNITFDTDAQYIVDNFKNDDYPILMDVYNRLYKMLEEVRQDPKHDSKEITRIKECIAFLDPLARGADSDILNGHTNIDLNNDLINFNIAALQDNTDSRVLKTQYYNILSFIWTDIISDTTNHRKQVYADEFSVIMDPRFMDIMLYFQTIAKRIRKYYGGLTTATQQINDVMKASVREQGEAIIENSVYKFFFSLGAAGIEYFNDTDLIPESEREFIKFAKLGQCYASFGTATNMRLKVQLDNQTLQEFEAMKA